MLEINMNFCVEHEGGLYGQSVDMVQEGVQRVLEALGYKVEGCAVRIGKVLPVSAPDVIVPFPNPAAKDMPTGAAMMRELKEEENGANS